MALHVYRPYAFPEEVDPAVRRELRRLGVRFETLLHDRTDAIVTLLDLRVDAPLLERLPRLRLVANVAVGYDNVDVGACTARGVMLTNTPDVLTEATADLAWALLLAAARRVGEAERFVRAGRFRRWDWTMLRGVDVHGKILGVVGAGRIGQAVGHRATGFSMQVLYTSRERKLLFEHLTLARRVELRTLLAQSDFVSIHVPLTKETRHLIGAKQLAMMKPTAVLVNTSRGPVVDEAALAEALRRRTIYAAGLDVFEREPAVHPALLKLQNAVLLPHIGSATEATRRKMYETALRNLIATLKGEIPPNCVNATGLGLR
jgi:glyoxylate reductase